MLCVVIGLIAWYTKVGGLKGEYRMLFLSVTVNTSGKVEVSLESDAQVMTPIGTFTVGAIVDPASRFKTGKLLIIRFNGTETFYDIEGREIDVKFESAYYESINFTNRKGNVVVDIWSPTPGQGSGSTTGSAGQVTALSPSSGADRLTLGNSATIHTTEGDPLMMRSRPSTTADVVLRLPNGMVVAVVDGPRTGDQYTWWKVRTNEGQEGWCVEGADGVQTLIARASAAASGSEANGCSDRPYRFSINEIVVVSKAGNGLRIMRDVNGGARTTLTQAVNGDMLRIVDGPICDYSLSYDEDIRYWWAYSYSDGVEGWAAEGISAETWLCHRSNPNCD